MKKICYIITVVLSAIMSSCGNNTALVSHTDYTRFVDPFIGTDYTGNTYPGAQVPFGMVQLSPDNGLPGWDRISGYYYPDSTIAGFSHTHLSGTGAGDLYDISFMPVTFPVREAESSLGIHSGFSHDRETATAGYYSVWLDDYDIKVELTATPRCGVQRYTIPDSRSAVILNLAKAMNWDATTDSEISIIDSVTIAGYRHSDGWAPDQHLWFASRFSEPWDSIAIDRRPVRRNGVEVGYATVAWFFFPDHGSREITVSTALSCTGVTGALANLAAEVPDDDFDTVREAARESWNARLGKIEVEGDNEDDKIKFYTALYHTMLAPTIYCDVDGSYRGPDKSNHIAQGWTNYGTFSLWDTYRAAHPLLTITEPALTRDIVKSLACFGRQNGRLPVWTFQGAETDMMIGYHSVPVIVDACLKGIVDESDQPELLDLCIATACNDDYRAIGEYRALGYVPCDIEDWSLSKTLEYAFDDYAIALLARKLGRDDIAAEYEKRSASYRNLFNPETRFMQPKMSDGNFITGFDPDEYSGHICESNAWQYLWSVQHDVDGLIDLLGGRQKFIEKLDSMMTVTGNNELPIFSTGMIGQYAHGNEPSHHVPYLYALAGDQRSTQRYVAEIMNDLYGISPAGLCGNEDCGQMSAWFVLSAIGFYPVNPVSGEYVLGTPLFESVRINLDNGNVFTVNARNLSKDNIFVKSVSVDGVPYTSNHITHDMIRGGATVEFEMKPADD